MIEFAMRCELHEDEYQASSRLILEGKHQDYHLSSKFKQSKSRKVNKSSKAVEKKHESDKTSSSLASIKHKYQHLIGSMRRKLAASLGGGSSLSMPTQKHKCLLLQASVLCLLFTSACVFPVDASKPSSSSATSSSITTDKQDKTSQPQALAANAPSAAKPQSRAGLSMPSLANSDDYGGQSLDVGDASDLDVLASQQQIPTAQLMSAAGHSVPDNFFLPGGSIPASFYHNQHAILQQQQRHQPHQQQQAQQAISQQDRAVAETLHQVAAVARQVAAASGLSPQTSARYGRAIMSAAAAVSPIDLLAAASEHQHQQQQVAAVVAPPVGAQHASSANQESLNNGQAYHSSLIDFNGYQLTTQPDQRDSGPQMDLIEFLNGGSLSASQQAQMVALQQQLLYEQQLAALHHHHQQQQQQQQQPHQHQNQHHQSNVYERNNEQQVDQLAAMSSNNNVQQDMHGNDLAEQYYSMGSSAGIGPDYQLIGAHQYDKQQQQQDQQQSASYNYNNNNKYQNQQQRPFGLPTKSSSREPSDMLKPLGNPKTVSSPVIDFVANNLPKQSGFEKLAEKMPAINSQPPTVFSFSSQKDPVGDKAKAINNKKRNVMRQAEQIAKYAVKSINDKFGTNLGEQTDIPFLLSTLGPLGFLQNVLLDPTLLVTLLNSAEKTYFSDVLPGPAKSVVRPVLNLFRVPNKKLDKANILNIISYLTSGGQTAFSSTPSKHRQFGIEKNNGGSKRASSR